jgi:acetyl-CoA carboxylase biotin carboxyl carrier protein
MLKFEEICELVRLVGSTGVAKVEITNGDDRIRIKGCAPATIVAEPQTMSREVMVAAAPTAPPAAATAAAPEPEAADVAAGEHVVTSPIVGTFYRAPNPDADPFVRVGDTVGTGKVLCIVEAMKLMNEIESDIDGTIVKVFPENAEPVEYGQPLFAIRPA